MLGFTRKIKMEHPVTEQVKQSLDKWTFSATAICIIGVAAPLLLAPAESAAVVESIYDYLTQNLGLLYLWYGIAALLFLLYLGLGRFGNVRLGSDDSKPEFSTLSWIAMIFCSGVGAGMLYWAVIEWGYYLDAPPFGIEPRSTQATEWAATYGLFHWGLSAWAFYCLPALAIAYPYYRRNVPYLRLSTGCLKYLPNGVESKRGRFIDFLYMLNLIGGSGTSLGLSTPMMAASLAELTGMTHDFWLEVFSVVFCIAIFGTSAWLGLDRGFKRLSDFNTWLAFTLLFFVLAVGPTLFILKVGTNSIGLVLQNFVHMLTWTDPIDQTGFVENWTIFYWAWWVAYGPFVGIFVTRISHGRTIKQVVFGMLCFGSLGAWLFFIIFGNYAMHLELNNIVNISTLIAAGQEARAITEVFLSLPLGNFALAAFLIVAVIFLATTYDSASYTLASVSTKNLTVGHHPARSLRVFWAIALGVIPISLMFVEGSLKVILSATIIVSLPLLVVGYLLASSLLQQLKEDFPEQ
jgi:BCCT family betaine/carnitine transporter